MKRAISIVVWGLFIIVLTSCFAPKADNNKDAYVENTLEKETNFTKLDEEKYQSYTDKTFNFTVFFPKDWSGKSSIPSIDGGIEIFIDNDEQNKIWVYGCYGTVSFPEEGFAKEIITRGDGSQATLLSRFNENDGIFVCTALDKFHGAIIQCDKKIYEANKDRIMAVLKSIEINGQPVVENHEMKFEEAYNDNMIGPSVTKSMKEKLLSRIDTIKGMGPGVGPWRIVFYNGERIILYNYAHIIACDITEKNKGIYAILELKGLKVGSYQGSEITMLYPSPDGLACVIGTGCWERDFKSTKSLYICNLYNDSVKELEVNYNMADNKVTWHRNMSSSTLLPWYVSIKGKDTAIFWDVEKSKKLNSIPTEDREETVEESYVEKIDFDTGYTYYFWWKKDENTVIGAPYRKSTNSSDPLKLGDFEVIEVNLKEKTSKILYKIPSNISIGDEGSKTVEQFYPLHIGAKSTLKYAQDFALFYEEVVLRKGNRALVLTSIGTKSSDIRVYEIEDDAIYEILRLEDDSKSNKFEYASILKLVMDKNVEELSNFIERLSSFEKRVVLKYPFEIGNSWDGGKIVDFKSDKELQNVKDYQHKGKPVPDDDTIVVKYADHYVFYKKNVGIIHYFYTDLQYPENM